MTLNHESTINNHYLTPQQLEGFRERLLQLRHELKKKLAQHLYPTQEASLNEADFIDRASIETDRSLEVQTRDQEQRLIFKIDHALECINNGTYGFCEETGAPYAKKVVMQSKEFYPA